jgi:acyl-CoA thioesterase II
VFGGTLVAQAASAASATISNSFCLYSSQSSFLAPTKPTEKIVYQVERTADGRGYSTRLVHAMQGETCTYIATLSFQSTARSAGNVLLYGIPMPDLGDLTPDQVDPQAMQAMQTAMLDPSVRMMRRTAEETPFDLRPFALEMGEDPSQCRIRGFIRTPSLSTSSHLAHLPALAYLSDESLFGTALAANPAAVGRGFRNVSLGASLTHNVSFHDPQARTDMWMVIERETSWGAEGRVLVHQKLWDIESGRMVMSVTQEALIRLKETKL